MSVRVSYLRSCAGIVRIADNATGLLATDGSSLFYYGYAGRAPMSYGYMSAEFTERLVW